MADDEDEIEHLEEEIAKLKKENRALKKGKSPKDPEISQLETKVKKLKLKKELHELEPHKKTNWKLWGIVAAIVAFVALTQAPSEVQTQAITILSWPFAAAFIYYFLLKPTILRNRGGDSKPAAKASSGH